MRNERTLDDINLVVLPLYETSGTDEVGNLTKRTGEVIFNENKKNVAPTLLLFAPWMVKYRKVEMTCETSLKFHRLE